MKVKSLYIKLKLQRRMFEKKKITIVNIEKLDEAIFIWFTQQHTMQKFF